MTQALAGFNEHGVILATDSRASRFDAAGRAEYFRVKKLLPLGSRAAILSGGAGVSLPLSQALRREIGRQRGLDHLEDMVDFALGFLSQGYRRFLARHGPEPEGFRRLYFILAGAVAGQRRGTRSTSWAAKKTNCPSATSRCPTWWSCPGTWGWRCACPRP